ncbi:hypothetical protein BaRGS_00029749 [Batillaria attramentaria]|uniref:Secreted protein n=1 Tax=Batillaria attramentaria TaxID=370345 RepID=A0ABD0JVT8_9CAEN
MFALVIIFCSRSRDVCGFCLPPPADFKASSGCDNVRAVCVVLLDSPSTVTRLKAAFERLSVLCLNRPGILQPTEPDNTSLIRLRLHPQAAWLLDRLNCMKCGWTNWAKFQDVLER